MRTFKNTLLIFLGLLSYQIFGQSNWVPKNPSPFNPGVRGIHLVDSQTIYMPRASGSKQLYSINGGKFWADIQFNGLNFAGTYFGSMSFPSKMTGYQVTNGQNLLFKTSNGGLSWQNQPTPFLIQDLSFADDTLGYAVEYGAANPFKFYKTVNAGAVWSEINAPFLSGGKIKALTKDILLAFDSVMHRSTDGGISWVRSPVNRMHPPSFYYQDANFSAIGKHVFMMGKLDDTTNIYRSSDYGATWDSSQINLTFNEVIFCSNFIDSLNGWFATTRGIYRTFNGGVSWTKIYAGIDPGFSIRYADLPAHIKFYNFQIGYFVTNSGEFFKTRNGGVSWLKTNRGFSNEGFSDLAFQTKSRPWLVGGFGAVAKSDNKGKTWSLSRIDSNDVFIAINFLNPREGFIKGLTNLFKTSNGGLSWTKSLLTDSLGNSLNNQYPVMYYGGHIERIKFFSSDTGFILGPFCARTTNGGQSWKKIFGIDSTISIHPEFFDARNGIIIHQEGHAFGPYNPKKAEIYRTSNGGESWETVSNNLFQLRTDGVAMVDFINPDTGFVFFGSQDAGRRGFYKTIDKGSSWIKINNWASDTEGWDLAQFRMSRNGLIGYGITRPAARLKKTEDGGATWFVTDTIFEYPGLQIPVGYINDVPVVAASGPNIMVSKDWSDEPIFTATGVVVQKDTNSCIIQNTEIPMKDRIVVANPGPFYGSTNQSGRYAIDLDTGSYQLSQITTSYIQAKMEFQTCPQNDLPVSIRINGLLDTLENNNFKNDIRQCPLLVTRLSQPFLRPCRMGTLTLIVKNEGTLVSNQEWLKVSFPKQIIFRKEYYPAGPNATDSSYRFQVGPLQPQEADTIYLIDSVVCQPNELTGRVLCIKCEVENTPICLLQSPNWDGADLEVASRCMPITNQTRFTIRNKGTSMGATLQYQIFIDSALVYQAPFQLSANNSMSVTLPANAPAGFARLLVPQSQNHPLSTFASAEANCATGQSTNGLFPPPDQSPLVDMECVTVTNSFDPNDKLVFPRGWGVAGNVEPETEFKYTIRFQNTGTDTAFKVVLVDTLDLNLDIASLQIGSSSHHYSFKVSGKGRPVLTWTFDNILLPDSNRNREGSIGYVDFSIRPKSAAAVGTRIKNFADIYFDFNDPIRTKTTVNTLWRPTLTPGIVDTVFVTTDITSIGEKLSPGKLQLKPNPASGHVDVLLPSAAIIWIVNAQGKVVLTSQAKTKQQRVDISSLKPGIYSVMAEGARPERLVVRP